MSSQFNSFTKTSRNGLYPRPVRPLQLRAPASARRRTGAARRTSSPFGVMAVRRRLAMRRSAVAAAPDRKRASGCYHEKANRFVGALPGVLHQVICAPAVPWVRTVYARENDMGCICAPRRSERAHRWGGESCCAQRSCASGSRTAGAAGTARAGLGATPQSEGLLRVRGRARLRTPAPPPRVAPRPSNPLREGRRAPVPGLSCTRPPNPSPPGTPAGLRTKCNRPSGRARCWYRRTRLRRGG